MSDDTPSWGIEPVPDRLRVLGLLDTTVLWGNLGVSLLVLVAGALLVPALSLPQALAAVLVGGLIGNLMLGAAGAIGADGRVPAMVLLRAPLGRRGSYLATGLNAAQCVGWAIFELIVIATAASALSHELLGIRAQWAWTLLFGAVATALAWAGPISVVRKVLKKVAVWVVLASLLYLTWWAADGADLGVLWDRPGAGGLSLWVGIDLVVALTVSWIPLVADYTRFSRDRRSAFGGVFVGYFLAGSWMFLLGAVLVLGRGLDDAASLPAAVAAAGLASALALLAVTVDETDEAFANVYSAAVSLQNVAPRVSQRTLIAGVAAVATAGALVIDLASYESFLLLLGSFFVPLFGVLLGDWLVRGARYRREDVFDAPPFRAAQVGAWLAGFALYQWLNPLGPSWWTDLLERTSPPELSIGSTIPSFVTSLALAVLAGAAVRRWRAAESPA
ncbi:MAG TPA: cytosine permease [Gaiellaceae bacterium]|nr:cytosine permease [Gaiellaceae bacterium]